MLFKQIAFESTCSSQFYGLNIEKVQYFEIKILQGVHSIAQCKILHTDMFVVCYIECI